MEAKKIIENELIRLKLPYTKLTARTINFHDLARGSAIFVKIWGWEPNPLFFELKKLASENGFILETDWGLG